ncbi:hypothetical protein GJAV_G00189160 [Gymnothorax javanicus]|nr:hypothetical protein GJAV_G00189160 [Gymnothorax javanicus]
MLATAGRVCAFCHYPAKGAIFTGRWREPFDGEQSCVQCRADSRKFSLLRLSPCCGGAKVVRRGTLALLRRARRGHSGQHTATYLSVQTVGTNQALR